MSYGTKEFSNCGFVPDCNTCADPYQGSGPESCGPVCRPEPKACATDCPPLRARNAIRMKSYETARWFNFSKHCRDDQFNVLNHCLRMELSRVQRCDGPWLAEPLSADAKGRVYIAWPTAFLAAPPGYYRADVLIDGCHCSTLLLWKPFCAVDVHAEDAEITAPKHAHACGCSFVDVEQPPYVSSTTDCGACHAGCH